MKTKRKPATIEPEDPRGTKNDHAYELYLRGQQMQMQLSSEAYLLALELYSEACALDPKFVRAQIALANLCCAYYREYSKNPKWLRKAEACLSEVHHITGVTVRTLYIRGLIEWLRGNMLVAEKLLIQATELDPTYSSAFNILGNLYNAQGKSESAIGPFRRALELLPGPQEYFNLLGALDASDHTEELKTVAKEALPVYDAYVRERPNDLHARLDIALVQLWSGDRESAKQMADSLFAMQNISGRLWQNLGCLYEKLGEPELYLTCLRRAVERGYREMNGPQNYGFDKLYPELKSELDEILQKMQDLIEQEQLLHD